MDAREGDTTNSAQTLTPPFSTFLTSAHAHFWRSLGSEQTHPHVVSTNPDLSSTPREGLPEASIVIVYSTRRLCTHMILLMQFLHVVQQIVRLSLFIHIMVTGLS